MKDKRFFTDSSEENHYKSLKIHDEVMAKDQDRFDSELNEHLAFESLKENKPLFIKMRLNQIALERQRMYLPHYLGEEFRKNNLKYIRNYIRKLIKELRDMGY